MLLEAEFQELNISLLLVLYWVLNKHIPVIIAPCHAPLRPYELNAE